MPPSFLPAMLHHVAADVPDYARTLEERTGCSLQELETLIRGLMPPLELHLTAEEIEALLPRWENAPAVQRTIGNITAELIRRALTDLAAGR